jgi:endonuclease/exonuclease/phosphatase family metal-dependent hydrolase
MISLFGAKWKDWNGTIPQTFPGKKLGQISLEGIEDVPRLCAKIAAMLKSVDADILGIQEGPPLKAQMELFVNKYLNDDYAVFTSNSETQTVHALVRKKYAANITLTNYSNPDYKKFWDNFFFQKWGTLAKGDMEKHSFARYPLEIKLQLSPRSSIAFLIVHTKSKFSKLKDKSQWEKREADAVLDALNARQKLSAEVYMLRQYAENELTRNSKSALVIMGDLNDGPLAESMEKEFLIHNIIDELIGSVVSPTVVLRHAMKPDIIAKSYSTIFHNPFKDNEIANELIDHILVSPSVWSRSGPIQLDHDSCRVEVEAYHRNNEESATQKKRQLRPSDHMPVSAVLEYKE